MNKKMLKHYQVLIINKRERKTKGRKTKQTCAQGAGRVLRTRLLFADTISPKLCPADGPRRGRHSHKKARRKARGQEEVIVSKSSTYMIEKSKNRNIVYRLERSIYRSRYRQFDIFLRIERDFPSTPHP